MKPLVWEEGAADDLESIGDWIARDSPRAALRVVESIVRSAQLLSTFPELGRAVDGTDVREFVLTRYPYILVYENASDAVRIRAVFHHRQQRR
jgi:toxin ParE1/3/4